MRTLTRAAVALAVVAVGACGSSAYTYDPYYGYYPTAYDDYYYDATMASGYYYYPSAYYYSLSTTQAASVSLVPPSVRLLLERWGAPIDPTCLTATTTADVDRDGIDVNSTITFNCSTRPNDGTAQVSGSVTVNDLDDTAADAGFRITFNGFTARVVTGTGFLTERVVNGSETIQKVGAVLRLIRDVVVDAADTSADAVVRRSRLDMKSQGVLTPEIGGAQVTRGTLVLSGQGTFTGPDGVVVVVTRQTDPSLHWNNDCTKVPGNQGPYDSGAIIYRSSRGRETRIVHESCTVATATNTVVPAQ